jgi:hypothetical protein
MLRAIEALLKCGNNSLAVCCEQSVYLDPKTWKALGPNDVIRWDGYLSRRAQVKPEEAPFGQAHHQVLLNAVDGVIFAFRVQIDCPAAMCDFRNEFWRSDYIIETIGFRLSTEVWKNPQKQVRLRLAMFA